MSINYCVFASSNCGTVRFDAMKTAVYCARAMTPVSEHGTARGRSKINRRDFLLLANSAGVALGAIACGVPPGGDLGAGMDTMEAIPGEMLSDNDAVSLRKQRYRRLALDGLDGGLDDFDDEMSARYAADIFTHVF